MSEGCTLEEIAYHEAGHAVAHFVFGFHNSQLTIRPNQDEGTLGWTGLLKHRSEEFEGRIISLLAGFVAQYRFNPDSRKDPYEVGAGHDFDVARGVCRRLGCDFVESEWIAKTEAFVEAEWPAIEALAKEAVIHRELDYDEIDLIIEAARSSNEDEAKEFRQSLQQYRLLIKAGKNDLGRA
jgi:hypothetical protein